MDRWMKRRMDRWMERKMDRRMDRWMERRMEKDGEVNFSPSPGSKEGTTAWLRRD